MKCIKDKKSEVISRVSNNAAFGAVSSGTAHYVSKGAYKHYLRETRQR